MKSRVLAGILVLAALTAGCGVGSIQPVSVDSRYMPSQYAQIPYRGDLIVAVAGNPFAMPQGEFEAAVRDALGARRPGEGAPGPQVLLAFNGRAIDSRSACSPAGGTASADGTLRIAAALCSGASPLTYTSGRIEGVTSADDPRFRAFLRQIVGALFPRQTEDSRDRDRDGPCLAMPGC